MLDEDPPVAEFPTLLDAGPVPEVVLEMEPRREEPTLSSLEGPVRTSNMGDMGSPLPTAPASELSSNDSSEAENPLPASRENARKAGRFSFELGPLDPPCALPYSCEAIGKTAVKYCV